MCCPRTSPPAPRHSDGEGSKRAAMPRLPPPSADSRGVLPLAIPMETGYPLAGGMGGEVSQNSYALKLESRRLT